MPYDHMTSNINQNIFALILATCFSALLIPMFPVGQIYIFFVFEIPLLFIVALITLTECLYSYKDEVSVEATFNMLGGVFKSLLISIPIVFFYGSVLLILDQTISAFHSVIQPLFDEYIQGVDIWLAIPLLLFIPAIIMVSVSPLLFYVYGKVHVLIWGKSLLGRKRKKAVEEEIREKEYEGALKDFVQTLEQYEIQLRQYILELQAMPKLIEAIDSYQSFKHLKTRIEMMDSYVDSFKDLLSAKENKRVTEFLKEEVVKEKIKEIEIQQKSVKDLIKKRLDTLLKEKKEYSTPPAEEEIEEE